MRTELGNATLLNSLRNMEIISLIVKISTYLLFSFPFSDIFEIDNSDTGFDDECQWDNYDCHDRNKLDFDELIS